MLYSALILGLISSLHCIGMCGPIAMMLPLGRHNPTSMALQLMVYHAGRLSAYALLGLVFGILGKGLFLAGLQQQLSIIAGIIMIVIALVPEKVFAKYNFSKPVYRLIAKVKSSLGGQLRNKSTKGFYLTGMFNGLLPCALVYAALFGAIAMQDEFRGVAYMLLYGLGTVPLMSAVVYASGFLSGAFRQKAASFVPYVMAFVGMLFIIRGLGLGIPYLSPSNASLFIQKGANCGIMSH